MAHHNTDIWRAAGPVDFADAGMWPNGGAWVAQHLWQHYLYSGDKNFLREYYPVLKGTADFLLSFMTKHPRYGWRVTAPSVSPEHGPNGVSIVAGCTMDNQIAFDALSNTLRAARIIGDSKAYCDSLQSLISQLPPMQIGQYNQLQEWLEDVDDPKDQHRHISHLYGLYPSNQISPYRHPELFQAAKIHCCKEVIWLRAGVLVGKLISGHVCWMEIMRIISFGICFHCYLATVWQVSIL